MFSRYIENKGLRIAILCLLCLLPILISLLSLAVGSGDYSLADLFSILFLGEDDPIVLGVFKIRAMRTVFGLICGAALGVAGALMQGVTRNPLADPSILGVNSGAGLFVAISIIAFGFGNVNQYIRFALFGAFVAVVIVFAISSIGNMGTTPLKLVLAGTCVTAAFSSITTALIMPRGFVVDEFRFRQIGGLGSIDRYQLCYALPMLGLGIALGLYLSNGLNILALGEESATGLGAKTRIIKLLSILAVVILSGGTTAIVGPIAFLGLVAPHIVRLLLGANYRTIIPFSALVGGSVLVLADVLGRIMLPSGELEAGIVTSFVGAPILIATVMTRKMKSL
jgi:iron complex transport system permease protein